MTIDIEKKITVKKVLKSAGRIRILYCDITRLNKLVK